MRIAVMSDMIRPNGAGVMALLAADLLTGAGHEVVVLGGAIVADLERQLDNDHFAAAGFTNDERALDGSVTPTDHRAFVRSFSRWLDVRLAEHKPDVLYVHNCGRVLSQLDLADLSKRFPVAHTMHDEWFFTDAHYTFRSGPGSPTVRTYEPGRSESVLEHRYEHLFEVPRRVGAFVAIGPSQWLTERARRVYPTLDVVHLPNAVDTSLFDMQDRALARATLGLPADRPIVLFVGSPSQERKAFAAFEKAVRHATSTAGETPLRLIVGGSGSVVVGDISLSDGPIMDRLTVPTASPMGRIGVTGDAVVVSGLDRSLMPALYGAADVLVHPSVIDNLPTVPIEAGLCGTRCLASDVGGTRETIADPVDLFDQQLSAADLGALIAQAIDDAATETVTDRQRRRGVQLERFGIDTHRSALLPLLENLHATELT